MSAPTITTLQEYQQEVMRTCIATGPGNRNTLLAWNALGLSGEAAEVFAVFLMKKTGDVADLIKKGIYHEQGIDRAKLIKELGDVLWYVNAVSLNIGATLQEVAQGNADKLRERYPNGWEPARSHRPGQAPAEDR